jgi:serine/threonine-protein kinase RsbW
MDRYILQIDPDPRLVPTARMFAATVARQLGCPEENVLDLKIAVSEACANAVQAHQEHGVDRPIEVSVEDQSPGLVYEVRDAGRGVDVPAEEPPEVFKRAVETGANDPGMGLALIRSLFPSAEFAPEGDGTVVRFTLAR